MVFLSLAIQPAVIPSIGSRVTSPQIVPSKIRWLLSSSAFRKHPLRILARCIAWELLCLRGRPVSWCYDSRFRVTLKPREGASRLAYYFGYTEPELFALYARIIKPGMVIVDAGANIGLHTLFFSRLVGNRGRVCSFEPDPRNFARLEEHLALNQIKNVTAVPCALGKLKKTAALFHDSSDSSRSHIVSDVKSHKDLSLVQVLSLDDYAVSQSLDEISFLKADVEGHELPLLQGASDLMSRGAIKVLQLEIETHNLERSGTRESTILELLHRSGYEHCIWNNAATCWQRVGYVQAHDSNPFFCHESLLD